MKETSSSRKLEIIPKIEKYIQYMLEIILKIPRTEKFSIGTEYKTSMYETLRCVMYLNKIEESKCLYYTNLIDAELNVQRLYLRIMHKNKWIDDKKFNVLNDNAQRSCYLSLIHRTGRAIDFAPMKP